jgi:phosphoribosyl-ATP pyrophosphohydrolase/phosphoribosyl-AMP cyclohydrolase
MRDRNAPLTRADGPGLAWAKMDGLLPAAVQDRLTGRLLMLAYMDREALDSTLESGFATFRSRSKGRLWQKGETSGNRLRVAAVHEDCDGDSLLVLVDPEGPACHLGTTSCFGGAPDGPGWLAELSRIVADRASSGGKARYTASLLREGPQRIAQKVGEEGVEVALAAVARDAAGCAEEVADLLFHLAVLMQALGFSWADVTALLRLRHEAPGR